MAYGFIPVRHMSGGAIRANSLTTWTIADDYATAIFRGDLVSLHSDGTLIQTAAGNTQIVGAFWGVQFKDSNTGEFKYAKYWPAAQSASEIVAFVYDDPNIVYRVEADQDTTALAAADIGNNCDIVVTAGSTSTGVSKVAVDSSTKATTAAQVRVLGLVKDSAATWTSAGTATDIEVVINEHFLKTTSGV